MLQGDFFTIRNLVVEGFDVKTELVINPAHEIFEGHFPGHPVVPGVCMMQMIKEIMELVTGRKSNLIKAQEMKFLAVIDPRQNNILQATLKYIPEEDKKITVSASLFTNDLTHFKFKGQFAFREPHS